MIKIACLFNSSDVAELTLSRAFCLLSFQRPSPGSGLTTALFFHFPFSFVKTSLLHSQDATVLESGRLLVYCLLGVYIDTL